MTHGGPLAESPQWEMLKGMGIDRRHEEWNREMGR
jgi:hypothetical protein